MESGKPILALNSGSSSLKFGLYRVDASGAEILVSGEAEAPCATPQDAVTRIADLLAKQKMPLPAAIGHRVVHGGPGLRRHCMINADVLRTLADAIPFAPLHIPPALEIIRHAQASFPGRPQIACFDTAFHAGLPDIARTLPIPKILRAEGIERYGFHGLSCESILHQLKGQVPRRLIIAHLGNGASITAVRDGKSVDTSMGLTPTGGVIMGTRTGDLDPGVLLYMLRQKKFDATALEELVDRQSGLLGISGLDSDMRGLLRAADSNDDARLAIAMFSTSVRKQIAAMIAVLEGVDLLVFTGGIGENATVIRGMICDGLAWAGLDASSSKVRVLPSQEDEEIARHSWALQNSVAGDDPAVPLQ